MFECWPLGRQTQRAKAPFFISPLVHSHRAWHKTSYDANDSRLLLFVSAENSQLKRSPHNLTPPAVHFCPITSPHLAQQESAGHEYVACFVLFPIIFLFSPCRKPLWKRMRNKAPSYPSARVRVNRSSVVKTRWQQAHLLQPSSK